MSYLFFIESSDGVRLADAAQKTLIEFLPKLLVVKEKSWDSRDFLANLRADFVNEIKKIEEEEEGVYFTEKQIGHSIIFGGADGFLHLVMERILSKEEKIELLAKLTLARLQKTLTEKMAKGEQKIIAGLLKQAISEETAAIQRQKSLEELDARRCLK